MVIAWQNSQYIYELLCSLHGKNPTLFMSSYVYCMAKLKVFMSSAHCMAKLTVFMSSAHCIAKFHFIYEPLCLLHGKTHSIDELSSMHGKTHRIDELFNNILVGFSVAEIHSRMKTNLSCDSCSTVSKCSHPSVK
jgi:hypothetical protein